MIHLVAGRSIGQRLGVVLGLVLLIAFVGSGLSLSVQEIYGPYGSKPRCEQARSNFMTYGDLQLSECFAK